MGHMDTLDDLSRYIRDCSLCGLGQTAPNPVLTTMRHFRQEFEDHIVARRCRPVCAWNWRWRLARTVARCT